jgi:hypothetical protein
MLLKFLRGQRTGMSGGLSERGRKWEFFLHVTLRICDVLISVLMIVGQ